MKRDEKYFKGCILGGAIGDALGRPIELKKLKEIKATYGSKGINNLTLNDKNELMNLVTIWFYDDPNESDD